MTTYTNTKLTKNINKHYVTATSKRQKIKQKRVVLYPKNAHNTMWDDLFSSFAKYYDIHQSISNSRQLDNYLQLTVANPAAKWHNSDLLSCIKNENELVTCWCS